MNLENKVDDEERKAYNKRQHKAQQRYHLVDTHLAMYCIGFLNGDGFTPYRLFGTDPIILGLAASFIVGYVVTINMPPPVDAATKAVSVTRSKLAPQGKITCGMHIINLPLTPTQTLNPKPEPYPTHLAHR